MEMEPHPPGRVPLDAHFAQELAKRVHRDSARISKPLVDAQTETALQRSRLLGFPYH